MEHVVFFPAPDGTPAFRRLPDLDEAVRLVEHLRNVEGVSAVSVHALTEVPLAFRAYYRVEVPSAVDVPAQADAPPVEAAAPVDVPAVEAAPEPAQEAVPVLALVEPPSEHEREPEPAMSTGNGHATPTSLGFFA